MPNVFLNVFVMLLSPGEQDTEGEHSKSPALEWTSWRGESHHSPLLQVVAADMYSNKLLEKTEPAAHLLKAMPKET